MKKYENGEYLDMTEDEVREWEMSQAVDEDSEDEAT
jgi:hypothetical protein